MTRTKPTGIASLRRNSRPSVFERRVQQTIRKFGMLQPGDHVLVAASGGADSTALLLCLHHLAPALGIRLAAAHLNHRLRGTESDDDEEFVRNLCQKLGISFVSERVDVSKVASEARKNLEEAAREARYGFLRRAASRLHASKIALGHNLNDQAETVLMRLIRGSSVQGVAAIHPVVDDLFIRPLLECRREKIEQYLACRGASYREDSTNQELQYQRNRVRHELIPYLEERFNPRAVEAVARYADFARDIERYLERQAARTFRRLQTQVPGGLAFPAARLLRCDPILQKLVIRRALEACRKSLRGITSRHIDGVLALCLPGQSGRRIELPGNCVAIRQFEDLVLLAPTRSEQLTFSYKLQWPGRVHVPEAGLDLHVSVRSRQDLPASLRSTSRRVFLDPTRLPKELIIRSRVPGDRYGGPPHKKVKKMLIDARVPSRSRSKLPMVVAGKFVIWIPGFKPAGAFAVQSDCTRCAVLEIKTRRARDDGFSSP